MKRPYGLRRPWATALVSAGICVVLGACTRLPLMAAGSRNMLASQYEGKDYVLKQSLFFGPFWDDPDVMLIHARPFDEVAFLLGPGGRPLAPGVERGVIPAGTRVRIERIELPSLGSLIGRPLLTPRWNGQVRLRVNRFDVPQQPRFEDITHVLVLPHGVTEPDEAVRVLDAVFGGDDVRDWMTARSPESRAAIVAKKARPGMSYAELVAALGEPDKIDRDYGTEGKKELAHFGSRTVLLIEDVVREAR